jgi:hypothetical protein
MRIQDHKLAWRWTDPQYVVLPEDVLARMIPVHPDEAGKLYERALPMLGEDALAASFAQWKIKTEKLEPSIASTWLMAMQPNQDQMVVLSWDKDAALRTNWGVFVAYWPEFCYPASDDLVVFPETEEWALLYYHEEEFHFGRRVPSRVE